ncbi:MAG: energy-coupling factor transporter transmembrane protein EcfT, partial [Evtepia sp.]
MALRDITLGQFFPGHSLIHRFDPRSKIISVFFFIVALFLAKSLLSYAILMVLLFAAVLSSHIRLSVFRRGLKPIVFIVLFTAILNLFFTPGRTIVSFWIFHITEEGLWTAGFMVLRILMLLISTLLLTYTTSPLLLTDGLEHLLRPLKKIHVP